MWRGHVLICVANLVLPLLWFRPCAAQVVQLPTTYRFGVSTTVWIPDGGSLQLGSVASARDAAQRRGWNRSFASERSLGSTQIRATIIDLDAMDRELRAEARSLNPERAATAADRLAMRLQQGLHEAGPSGADPAAYADLHTLRRQAAARNQVQQQEAHQRLARAEALWEKGWPAEAKVWFRMAYAAADADLRLHIQKRWRALSEQAEAQGS